ncbi:MAG: ATP-binding protein [Candidatus Latescibacter sp.]|nr:ATP-binding protein [Candidatus Latescibacter sp.]
MNTSLRVKLFISFFIAVFIMGITAAVISVYLIREWSLHQTQERLEKDLSMARKVYTDRIAEIQTILTFTSLRTKTVKGALIAGDIHTLLIALQEVRNVSEMDVLTVTDPLGKVILRAHHPDLSGDSLLYDALVARVIKTGNPASGTVIVPRSILKEESDDLAERIVFPAVSQYNADSHGVTGIESGMMIEAAVPIAGDDKRMIGILIGGKLLNGNRSIVDSVKNAVFANDLRIGNEAGMVALYQGTLCIAANTAPEHGSPVLGTIVHDDILEDSMTYTYRIIKRTMVSGRQFIAAFDAIRGVDGKVIGMLSVGLYESAFLNLRKHHAIIIVGVIVFSMFCALAAWFMLSKRIVRPIKDLAIQAQQMIEPKAGSHYHPRGGDEVDVVGKAFDHMISSIREQDTQIKTIRKEINQARRLSTLGKLAAGVAHEINNPLCGIVVYSNLVLEDMSPDDPRYSNVEKIIRESNRCRNIVKSLLDFARQSHPQLNPAEVNIIITEALNNLRCEPIFKHIQLAVNLDSSLPRVIVDASQIQEVFENILRNAAEAMDVHGTLTVMNCIKINEDDKRVVEVQFADTGPGIPPEHIGRIFDPFFTTKKCGHGTGLGLAVSYGIIERHGGLIAARNSESGGAVFTVELPVEEADA